MYYDLNVPWSPDSSELPRIAAFLHELGYNTIALTHTLEGQIPAKPINPIPTNPFPSLPFLRVLTRCTLILDDPSQMQKLGLLTPIYDIVAIRPTNEKLLLTTCSQLEHVDLISLDFGARLPFLLKYKVLGTAIARGLKFEVSYAGLATGDIAVRRNLIGNAVSLVRALRGAKGGGVVVSSEAKKAAAARAPMDVINIAGLWGYGGERGRNGIGGESRAVVVWAEMRRRSWRGVVDVVGLGEVPRVIEVVGGQKRKRNAEEEAAGKGPGNGGEKEEKGGKMQKQQEQRQGQEGKKKRKKGGGGVDSQDIPNT
ncbi:PHP domain-like protein [Terfezia boudieri ATCC MYA-4762]|uniref:PHP domain-like protein n=1 Tax=Terfezia boudieri ATCC MYA-4762 TaxID=1051890 RepID=A0A3N4LW76_9PEZI|nr:PHP domain-like protein [Terfezia boudieri ATCC MYA-4762]